MKGRLWGACLGDKIGGYWLEDERKKKFGAVGQLTDRPVDQVLVSDNDGNHSINLHNRSILTSASCGFLAVVDSVNTSAKYWALLLLRCC